MNNRKYLLNNFTITDAERLVKLYKQLEKLIDGSVLPTTIDRKFFIDIVKSNLKSDVLIFHPSKFFKYALSYLRWLKRNKIDLKKYIDSYYAHREVLNKSYKTTKPKFVDIKIPFVKKTSEIDKIKDQLNRSKESKDKKKISPKNNSIKSYVRCTSCNSYISLERIRALPSTTLCINCASQDPSNKKNRFIKDTFGSRNDYKRDRGSWRR